MKRILIVAVIQLGALALGVAAVILFFLDHLLEPIGDAMNVAYVIACAAMAALTAAAMTVAIRHRDGGSSSPLLGAMMALTALAGFIPIVAHSFLR